MVRLTYSVLAGIVLAAGPVTADTITLSPTADTRILDIFPTSNFGSDILSTFHADGNEQRTVVHFDLSGVPAGQTIDSATLRLHGTPFNGSTAATSMWAFRVAAPWTESQATWLDAATGTPWASPGGELVGTGGVLMTDPYATWTGDQSPLPTWYELNVTTLIAAYYDGTHPNYGIGLAGPLGNELVFTQSESTASPNRPALVIEYSPIPEPASIALVLSALLALRPMRRG